jgi:hypothetical protein
VNETQLLLAGGAHRHALGALVGVVLPQGPRDRHETLGSLRMVLGLRSSVPEEHIVDDKTYCHVVRALGIYSNSPNRSTHKNSNYFNYIR